VQGQTWDYLLFAHWRVDADALRTLLPEQLPLDLYDGDAWLGITPFRITGFRLRGTLPLPVVSSFLEVNVRTYATYEGKPGIWFFSLDAESRLAAEAAKLTYRLPYHHARIGAIRRGEWIEYRSDRTGAVLDVSYRPAGPIEQPPAGSLEHFLTERYCLYAEHDGALHRAEIHHAPWPLQAAEADFRENTMSPVALEGDPLLHYSERQDVVLWSLERA
jgi:uncharacterized protein YqjF (DUF2071 family)